MASYGLLTALSGFRYQAATGSLRFAPRVNETDFRVFFCIAAAWGAYAQRVTPEKTDLTIRVDYGTLPIQRLVTSVSPPKGAQVVASLSGQERHATLQRVEDGHAIVFDRPLVIDRGAILKITIA
jgi:hypothetical protein